LGGPPRGGGAVYPKKQCLGPPQGVVFAGIGDFGNRRAGPKRTPPIWIFPVILWVRFDGVFLPPS